MLLYILTFAARAGINSPYQLAVPRAVHSFDHLGAHATEGTGYNNWDLVCHKAPLRPQMVESVRNLS